MTQSAVELLADLERLGVELKASGNRLRYRARAGVLTRPLKQALADNKVAILALIGRPKPSHPHGCGSREWWWRSTGGSGDWVCSWCHPRPLARPNALPREASRRQDNAGEKVRGG